MDSRIREIEQWINEAKTDLDERGREAYVNKLYLLDAEIRSVIRENGMQPGAASPQPAERRVRRRHVIPAFASGAALGALLLAASTVYFASPGMSLPVGLPWNRPQSAAALVAAAPVREHRVFLPAGEQIVDAGDSMPFHQPTMLSSSPSEEKAGDTNPPAMQASGAEVSLNGNSKPSALAHPSVPAPASTTPAKPAAAKPGAAKPAPASKPVPAPLILASAKRTPAAAAAPPAATLPRREDATPVSLAAMRVQPVDKPAVDNGDSAKKINPETLTRMLEDGLNKRAH